MAGYYVNPYVKDCIRVFPEQGRYGYYRYDMNENPEGLPKEFVDNVLNSITPGFLSTYPEPDAFLKKYASFVGVNYENVLTTNGSDMAIRYLLEIFCEKGKKVVTVSPSFEMYRVNCLLLGLEHVPVNYETDMTIDVSKLLNAIDNDTDIVVLLNPNNPIGNVYTDDEVGLIIKKANENNAVVIIDEAYYYFYDKSFLKNVLKYNNVVVLRTFSKLFSLAACRLGIIISNNDIIGYVKKLRMTFEVNAVALKFAERLIESPEIVNGLIDSEKQGKKYILYELSKIGYEVKDGLGNYIFIKTHKEPLDIFKELKNKKVLIKIFDNSLLKDYIRVSVGSKKSMEFFIEKFLEVDCIH